MADAQLLENFRKESGKSKSHLAVKLQISRPYLYRLLKHPEKFPAWQAKLICKELNITKKSDWDKIFLP